MSTNEQDPSTDHGPGPPQWIAIDDLFIEPAIQARQCHLHAATVSRYRGVLKAAEGDRERIAFPPVKVAAFGDRLYLVDGFHRVHAHGLEGFFKVKATVQPATSLDGVRWLAVEANLAHGKPLNFAETREAFRRFVKARMHRKAPPNPNPSVKRQRPAPHVMTLGEIGLRFGTSKPTITNWFQKADRAEYNRLYRAGGDGVLPNGGVRRSDYSDPTTDADLMEASLSNGLRIAATMEDVEGQTRALQAGAELVMAMRKVLGEGPVEAALADAEWVAKVDRTMRSLEEEREGQDF